MNELNVLVSQSKTLKLRKGEVTVREVTLEDAIKLAETFVSLFKTIDPAILAEKNPVTVTMRMLVDPSFMTTVKKILSVVTDQVIEFYDNIPLLDLLKLVRAFFEVNPRKELQAIFFEIQSLLEGDAKERKSLVVPTSQV